MSAASLWDFLQRENVIKGDSVAFAAFVLILLVRQEVISRGLVNQVYLSWTRFYI